MGCSDLFSLKLRGENNTIVPADKARARKLQALIVIVELLRLKTTKTIYCMYVYIHRSHLFISKDLLRKIHRGYNRHIVRTQNRFVSRSLGALVPGWDLKFDRDGRKASGNPNEMTSFKITSRAGGTRSIASTHMLGIPGFWSSNIEEWRCSRHHRYEDYQGSISK